MALAKVNSNWASNYLVSFVQCQLSNAANFLDNAWLVNKFPDELTWMGDAMSTVLNTRLNEHTRLPNII
jgi:hypothetical protein